MGLARETAEEFRKLLRGQVIGLPRHSGTVRVKAAAWISGKMKEQLVDTIVLRPVNIEIKRSAGKDKVTVRTRTGRTDGLYLSASWLTASDLCGRSTACPVVGTEWEMPFDPDGYDSIVFFTADMKELACCVESFRHAPAARTQDLQTTLPAPVRSLALTFSIRTEKVEKTEDSPAGIFDALFETFRLRAEDSALSLSFFIGLNFRLFFLKHDNRHLEFSKADLNRLYSMLLLDPYILPEEKLSVFFNLRLLWINRERHQSPEMTALAGFLLPKAVRKTKEEAGIAFLLRDLTVLLYANVDDPGLKNRTTRRLKKEILRSKNIMETAHGLLLLAHQDAAFVRRLLLRFFPEGRISLDAADITTALFPLLDALDFAQIPYDLSESG